MTPRFEPRYENEKWTLNASCYTNTIPRRIKMRHYDAIKMY